VSELPNWKTISKADLRPILAGYCAEGLSAQRIADKFQNCTRSAVIGMISRLKLQLAPGNRRSKNGRLKAGAEPKPPAVRRASKLVQQTSSWRGANNPPASDFKARSEQRAKSPGLPAHLIKGEPRRPVADLTVVPVSRGLKLVELTEQTCKWPNGDPQAEDFGFCGTSTAETGPYCRYHARIASTPPIHRLSAPKGA
jgi:GcrA cell cycle regulator